MIEIQGLTVIYKGRIEPAVDNLNLNIERGEFHGLLGPNGAGKTTLISTLSSLVKPTQGKIFINNIELSKSINSIKKIIGIVPQEIALYDKLTVYENLKYFGTLLEVEKNMLNNKIDNLLNRLGLLSYKHYKIKNLSGGMKRRINLMAGILHEPEIIILDEPVVGLDVQSRNLLRTFLKELNELGSTVLYTSHIMEDIEKMCSNISIIDYGKIIEKGSPAQLLAKHNDCKDLEDIFLKLTGQNTRD